MTAASTAKIGIAGDHYAGWLHVRRPIAAHFDSYRTERLVDFDGGWTELRRFSWSQPLESVWRTDARCYFLSLTLDGPAEEASRRNLGAALAMPFETRRVMLVPPGQTIRSAAPSAGSRRSMRCLIDTDVVESLCPARPTIEECVQLGATDLAGGAIEWLMFRMYREIAEAEIGMAVAIECIAREIAVEIVRLVERQRRAAERRTGGLPPWRLRLLLDRIHAEAPLPTVSELAELGGMTTRHLGRAFQAETGKTIGKAIAAAMAERAVTMLKAGAPVASVAATLGYTSSSSFAFAFRRETGLLPSALRG